MDAEAEFDRRLLFEQIRADAKETYKQNPFDVDRWSGALLELAQFHNMSDSKQMIQDAITKLEEALLSDPKKHDALWCVRNAYTSFAFLTPEETEAKYKFDLSTQFFQQVVEEQRENPLYLKSLELTAKDGVSLSYTFWRRYAFYGFRGINKTAHKSALAFWQNNRYVDA